MRIAIAALALCLFAAGLPASAGAPATERTPINIPAQDLESALRLLAKERDLQVIYRSELVGRLRTAGAAGNLTALEALNRLLNGTGLTFRHLNDQTVTIVPVDDRTATGFETGRAALSAGEPKDIHEISGPGVMRLARSDVDSAQDANGGIRTGNDEVPTESSKGVPEMLVKGKRSSNIDIRRTEDDVQPYVVFTAEDIERSMAGSLDQFLMSRLPMNTSQYRADDIVSIPLTGNISSINLRGLGPNQTLILVNGRRLPGVSTSSDLTQPDINGIPMSSVARIEVLPSTAGGIYGGGATGGVINIVTRKDYSGLDLNLSYGNAFDTDAAQRRFDASAGFNLESGRTRILISASDSTCLAR